MYTEGSVLAPHVDRMPLVISAIVNVAQDVDEPWPLEVYGHDGMAYNITMVSLLVIISALRLPITNLPTQAHQNSLMKLFFSSP